jgi:hypothetical protein
MYQTTITCWFIPALQTSGGGGVGAFWWTITASLLNLSGKYWFRKRVSVLERRVTGPGWFPT